MHLLHNSADGNICLTNWTEEAITPPYAILSHTWGQDNEEVTFEDLVNCGTAAQDKVGYRKLIFCKERAERDGLKYFWIDTCCINKSSKVELSLAINSMFRWYRNSARCYVYLSDVSFPGGDDGREESINGKTKEEADSSQEQNKFLWESQFRNSRWFTRGWTLQELLAPDIVDFFSKEGTALGAKSTLQQLIHEITGISCLALEGAPLTNFGVDERLSWNEHRTTKLEEDRAYSLLGIFDVYISPFYGEGAGGAFRRLMGEIEKLSKCIQDMHITDPRYDKKRIEDTKGGLLKDSYSWILDSPEFQRWRSNDGSSQNQMLWIKGDPGKGKTMLLCGIVNELEKSITKGDVISYFFCQATDSRINAATAVLRGLLYMLVDQKPSLIYSFWKKYEQAGKSLFEDANAWVALKELFTGALQDPQLKGYIVIDALDECVVDLSKLLAFIGLHASTSSNVKWIVSSRNWVEVHEWTDDLLKMSLELNADSVSAAVNIFIQQKVSQLAHRNKYESTMKSAITEHLVAKADNTFLWVALVCQNLEGTPKRHVMKKLNAFPPGLDSLYGQMMQQIGKSDDAEICKEILSVVSVVYRPIQIRELISLVELLDGMDNDLASVLEIINLCGSFLTVDPLRMDTIYFIHQSAKDFLLAKASNADKVLPMTISEAHHAVFSRSLKSMSRILRRDMYNLHELGYPIWKTITREPDPLWPIRYSCAYWVDHLCELSLDNSPTFLADVKDGGIVDIFLQKKYLYWLEALSLCQFMSKGVASVLVLKEVVQRNKEAKRLLLLVEDAHRFIIYHKTAIEPSPLQAYACALLFSPRKSLVRNLFKHEEPKWFKIKPDMEDKWSPLLLTLEKPIKNREILYKVLFSYDSKLLATVLDDGTIDVWDVRSGERIHSLKGSDFDAWFVAFSYNSLWLALTSQAATTIEVWDMSTGTCIQRFEREGCCRGKRFYGLLAFSDDSRKLAVTTTGYDTIKIWDMINGTCIQTIPVDAVFERHMAFSQGSTQLISASMKRAVGDSTFSVWDVSSGTCLHSLRQPGFFHSSAVFSHDLTTLAENGEELGIVHIRKVSNGDLLQTFSGDFRVRNCSVISTDLTRLAFLSGIDQIQVWDLVDGTCTHKIEDRRVESIAFSHDSKQLALGASNGTVKLWDLSVGIFPKSYNQSARACNDFTHNLNFSNDSTRMASVYDSLDITIWDPKSGDCLQVLKGHKAPLRHTTFSHDSELLASDSRDELVKIWDTTTGTCLQTLAGHNLTIQHIAFSHDAIWLATASNDALHIWDVSTGACLQTLRHDPPGRIEIFMFRFSHNSAKLASATNPVMIWNTSSGACHHELNGHGDQVTSVAFSSDSTILASASYDSTVRLWEVDSGSCLRTISVDVYGDAVSLTAVAFSQDSNVVAVAEAGGMMTTWDAHTGQLLNEVLSRGRYWDIAFDATGDYLSTKGGGDILIRGGDSGHCEIPQFSGFSFSENNEWIMYKNKNVLWLPFDRRPRRYYISGNHVGMVSTSGRISIYSFSPDGV